jgi:hypothetical protein
VTKVTRTANSLLCELLQIALRPPTCGLSPVAACGVLRCWAVAPLVALRRGRPFSADRPALECHRLDVRPGHHEVVTDAPHSQDSQRHLPDPNPLRPRASPSAQPDSTIQPGDEDGDAPWQTPSSMILSTGAIAPKRPHLPGSSKKLRHKSRRYDGKAS